jgi:hypothetical protein
MAFIRGSSIGGGGGGSAEITFDFTPYKWNGKAIIQMAEDIGGSNVGGMDDASQSIMSFTATGDVTVNITPFAAYTNTSSDDGYVALVVDGVTKYEKQIPTSVWTNVSSIPSVVLGNGETLEVRCGFHNHHSGCFFQLSQI